MSKTQRMADGEGFFNEVAVRRLKRWTILTVFLGVGLLILFLLMWNTFFRYVPPGKMLLVTKKFGSDRDPARTMSKPDEKGVQEQVLGEGWHFIMPIMYTTDLADNLKIPADSVGIVEAQGGKAPAGGGPLTENDDEKGIRRKVLTPGTYRLNPKGYTVKTVKATQITAGHVGVQRRRLGKDTNKVFAENPDEKGILREVLEPGLYFINTEEYEVTPHEVGIYQISYRYDEDNRKNTGLKFPVKDGYEITLDCTVEWEILPQNVPDLAANYKGMAEIERNVIDQQARKICRDRGFNYGAQDFLEGEKREKFQEDFIGELKSVCKKQLIEVRSAYIRNIVIPENFMKPKRDRRVSEEVKVTNEAKQELAKSDAEVERERTTVDLAVAKVKAETIRKVAEIDIQVENLDKQTTTDIELLSAQYNAKIAALEAQTKLLLAEAETDVTKLKETAKSGIHKMKLDLFQGDGNAYVRYTLAEQLNPKLVLRLFHAGPGTFWTNLDGKNMNLMLAPNQGEARTAKGEKEPAKPQEKPKN